MGFAIHRHESAMGVHVSHHPEPAFHLPPHPIPQGCPRTPALSALLHASNLHLSCILHMVIYTFQCYSILFYSLLVYASLYDEHFQQSFFNIDFCNSVPGSFPVFLFSPFVQEIIQHISRHLLKTSLWINIQEMPYTSLTHFDPDFTQRLGSFIVKERCQENLSDLFAPLGK